MDSKLSKIALLDNKKLSNTLKKNKLDVLIKIKEYLDDKYYNTGETSEFTDEKMEF